MKLTADTKSLIKEKIKTAYPFNFPQSARLAEVENIINDANKQVDKRMKAINAQVLKEVAKEFGLTEEEYSIYTGYGRCDILTSGSSALNKARSQAYSNWTAKIEKIYADVVLTLELGGSKAELREILTALENGTYQF